MRSKGKAKKELFGGHEQAEEALKKSLAELENLQYITNALLNQQELSPVMNTIAEGIVDRLGYDMVLVSRYVEGESAFTGLALYPLPMAAQFDRFLKLIGRTDLEDEPTRFQVPYRRGENPLVDRVIAGEVVIGDSLGDFFYPWIPRPAAATVQKLMGLKTFVDLPMQVQGKTIGTIVAGVREPMITEAQQQALARVAGQAAVAVEKARLYDEMQRELAERKRAEQEIKERQRYLEGILAAAPDAIVTLGADRRIVEWNPGAEKLFGYSATETVGRDIDDLVSSHETFEEASRFTQVALNGKFIKPVETVRYRKDGSPVNVIVAGSPILIEDELIGTVGVYTDITERRRMEEALRQRTRELATLYQATTTIISDLSLDAVLSSVAEQIALALGSGGCVIYLWDRERNLTEVLIDYSVATPETTMAPGTTFKLGDYPATRQVLETRQPMVFQRDDPLIDKAELALMEEQRVYTLLVLPLIARDQVWGLVELFDDAAARDYTPDQIRLAQSLTGQAAVAIENAQLHQKVLDHAEQLEQRVQERTIELAEQYARLDAILRSTTDGIVVTDAEGNIIQANPVAQRWLTQALPSQGADLLRETIQSVATQIEEQSVELLELTGLDLELSAGVISAPEPTSPPVIETSPQQSRGNPQVVVVLHDVSHFKWLDRMKTRFITNISHELRTPITTIKLYAYLMQRRPGECLQYLEPLAQEADHQAGLLEDILEISRIDAGWIEIHPRPASLNDLAQDVIAGHQSLAQKQQVALEYHPAHPGPMALIDAERITQALNNLVKNAIRFTPEGGKVTVSTGMQEMQGRTHATVTVSDTGMGIPKDELPHIFDRFFRGDKPRSMQLTGTGLGLSITQGIAELHGGQVTVKSEEDLGSTFTVWLPLADEVIQ